MIKKWFTLILAMSIQTIVIAQNNYIENRIIIKMENDYSSLNPIVNKRGISITDISEIDQLNIQYECTDIQRLYKGPNENAVGLYIFRFSDNIINENILNIYTQTSSIKSATFDELYDLGQTYPNDWNNGPENGLIQMFTQSNKMAFMI